jgi:hypothetical protein
MLLTPLLWFFIPDSVSWLVSENRLEEAADVVEKAAKLNGKKARKYLPNIYIAFKPCISVPFLTINL